MYAKEYCEYLKSRSSLSLLYKKLIVYPRLLSHTKDEILDYGCGIGDLISYKKSIIGVDINEYCTKYCIERGFKAFTISNNVLPFEDKKFSTVILDNVFEHLEKPEDQFSEIKRVISDNGVVIIGVPGIKGDSQDSTHIKLYEEEDLISTLDSLGFTVKNIFYTPFVKSNFLSKKVSFYVLWGVFHLTKKAND